MLIQWFPRPYGKDKTADYRTLESGRCGGGTFDARIPLASANPMVEELLSGKPRSSY